MTIQAAYQYNANGIFLGRTMVQEDPLKTGQYLLPPQCTLVAPPAFDASAEQAVFANGAWSVQKLPTPPENTAAAMPALATPDNKPVAGVQQIAVVVNGQWQLLADYRGMQYWLPDGSEHLITEIGTAPPADALMSAPALTLAQAQSTQIATLRAAYQSAVQQPVSYTTSAGHADTFAADTQSVGNIDAMLAAYAKTQQFPLDLWLNAAGAPVTPFSYADLQGLAEAIADRATPDYQELLSKISDVMTATTVQAVQAVQAVTW